MFTRLSVADVARYAALLAAMFISFSTQRHLALTHGVPDVPSYAVPMAIDLYLIWAVRTSRDVALAVSVAVSANVAGVLSTESLSAVSTWVSAALHAVFPLTVWRMHRPWVTAEAPEGEPPTVPVPEPEVGAATPAEALPDTWPTDDLWQDFEASEPDADPATPPSAADVRTAMASLAAEHGRPATGRMLADHFRVSERTGRRYLRMTEGADA
ncbi:transfer protein spdA [Streptomyces sp. NPDC002285]